MFHCCKFKPDDIYYLKDSVFSTDRKLYVGFCPICSRPVAELIEFKFTGDAVKQYASGIKANEIVYEHKEEILYSMRDFNYGRFKPKPFGWKYGINKSVKKGNNEILKQYACDFYGNKELIKTSQIKK